MLATAASKVGWAALPGLPAGGADLSRQSLCSDGCSLDSHWFASTPHTARQFQGWAGVQGPNAAAGPAPPIRPPAAAPSPLCSLAPAACTGGNRVRPSQLLWAVTAGVPSMPVRACPALQDEGVAALRARRRLDGRQLVAALQSAVQAACQRDPCAALSTSPTAVLCLIPAAVAADAATRRDSVGSGVSGGGGGGVSSSTAPAGLGRFDWLQPLQRAARVLLVNPEVRPMPCLHVRWPWPRPSPWRVHGVQSSDAGSTALANGSMRLHMLPGSPAGRARTCTLRTLRTHVLPWQCPQHPGVCMLHQSTQQGLRA